MTATPVISIITPVWNGLPYLKECVESVLAQKFSDWEMIISDDGSNDGSREYLDTIRDPRIKIIKQEKNLGIFGNLNFVFRQAKAPISQILCQDDYFISPESLEIIVTYWQAASPELGFVRFNHEETSNCMLTALQKKITPPIIKPVESNVWFYLFGNIPGNLSNVSMRTNLVLESGDFRQNLPYAGDFEFWSRAARTKNMGVENLEVIYVRRHPGVASIFLNRKGELLSQNAEIAATLFGHLVKKYPDSAFALKLHGTLNYDTLQRDAAVRMCLAGNRTYLKELNRVSNQAPYALNILWRWFLLFATLGGRIGRVASARYLIRKLGLTNDLLNQHHTS